MKWFVDESDSAAALAVLTSGETLIAPDLVIAELCNAAGRLRRKQEMTLDQVGIVADRASIAFAETVPSGALAAKSMSIAVRLDHPVYDCLYVALAELRDARLVTADRRLVTRVGDTPWHGYVVALDEFGPTE